MSDEIIEMKFSEGAVRTFQHTELCKFFKYTCDVAKKKGVVSTYREAIIAFNSEINNANLDQVFSAKGRFSQITSRFPRTLYNKEIEAISKSVLRLLDRLGDDFLANIDKHIEISKHSFELNKGGRDIDNWAEIFGIKPKQNSQERLNVYEGNYILIRPIFSEEEMSISFTKIEAPVSTDHPARFQSHGDTRGGRTDDPLVSGACFIPEGEDISMMMIGRQEGRTRLIATIFEEVRKSEPFKTKVHDRYDLKGIRLAMATFLRGPIAYRIWCTRVNDEDTLEDWQEILGRQNFDTYIEKIENRIDGIQDIDRWLRHEPEASRLLLRKY